MDPVAAARCYQCSQAQIFQGREKLEIRPAVLIVSFKALLIPGTLALSTRSWLSVPSL